MNSFSRHWNPNGARQRNTAAGRAISISTSATTTAPSKLSPSRCGQTSRPSSTNITICASQVTASRKTTTELCARVCRLPTTSPAR